jgi:hypothetical protein
MKIALIVAGLAAGALYFAFIVILAVQQRRFVFVPDTRRPDVATTGVPSAHAVTVRTGDGLDLLAWLAPPDDDAQPVVLYLHGNAGNIGDRTVRLATLNRFGWGVMLLEYRGYGGNPGAPTEIGLFADARAGYEALRAIGIAGRRIVLWGESLGSGIAVQLATQVEVGAVLLESPYTSIAAIGQKQFPLVPVYWLLRDHFDLIGRIGVVRVPVLVMTGGRDRVVPPAMGQAVFTAANKPKVFWLAPDAGHNDLVQAGAFDAVRAFVATHWAPADSL